MQKRTTREIGHPVTGLRSPSDHQEMLTTSIIAVYEQATMISSD